MRRALAARSPAALVAPAAALANDSVAETAAGGLVLRHSRDIDMVSEDLYVSAERGPGPLRLPQPRRARPVTHHRRLPDARPRPRHRDEGEIAWPARFPHPRRRPRRSRCRSSAGRCSTGVDHTRPADRARRADRRPRGRSGDATRRSTPCRARGAGPPRRASACAECFSEPATARRSCSPLWTVRETWYWEQVFPAGRDLVVEHRYRPGAGGTVDHRARQPPTIARPTDGRAQIARYCIDARLPRRGRPDRPARERDRISDDRRDLAALHPHHRRQLALADRRFPAGRRQGPARAIWSASAARACAGSARPGSRCAAATGGPTATSTC